jgi:hypothetical protein
MGPTVYTKRRLQTTILRYLNTHLSADLIYKAAEDWNHASRAVVQILKKFPAFKETAFSLPWTVTVNLKTSHRYLAGLNVRTYNRPT